MKRKRSCSGIVGLLMLIVAAKLFPDPHSEYVPLWVAWLVGPLLWYGGFMCIFFWLLHRFVSQEYSTGEETTGAAATLTKPRAQSADKFEVIKPGASYKKLALLGMTLATLIVLGTTLAASFR